jgi:hypothetical protein
MGCPSCLEKGYRKYRAHGLDHETALRMAKKLMKRVEKRQRKEKIRFWYKHVNSFLWRWTLLCNWKATLLWTVKLKRLIWIGGGFNPDYTLACAGTCNTTTLCPGYTKACDPEAPNCDQYGPSPNCAMATCACQTPLPHSTQISSGCTCTHTEASCILCSPATSKCTQHYVSCPCAGTCGYNCDAGYSWNDSQCVLPSVGGMLAQVI